jgi:hypothetical protein
MKYCDYLCPVSLAELCIAEREPSVARATQRWLQPRKPVSFTSARRYSKDPGALWSREPPDFRGNSNCRLFAI